jgi:hypothetical protein
MNPIPAAPRPPGPRPIDDGWRQWIAEQRLRDCTPESMADTMVAAGCDRAESAAAIARMESDPVFKAARRHQQLQRKLQSVAANLQRMWELAPDYTRIEKRPTPGIDEFMDRYVAGCRPVVFTDVARDWPAMQRWSPQDLKARFGHLEVEVQAERSADPKYERTSWRCGARFAWPTSSTRCSPGAPPTTTT